jgi:hypothetical protein
MKNNFYFLGGIRVNRSKLISIHKSANLQKAKKGVIQATPFREIARKRQEKREAWGKKVARVKPLKIDKRKI